MSASISLLAALSAVTGLLVVLFLNGNAAFNSKGVGANIDLVIYLIGSGALVTSANRINLIKFVGNLFVVSFSNGE